jgi:hypothetical protein
LAIVLTPGRRSVLWFRESTALRGVRYESEATTNNPCEAAASCKPPIKCHEGCSFGIEGSCQVQGVEARSGTGRDNISRSARP